MKNGWQRTGLRDLAIIETGKWDANHAVEGGAYRFYTCAADFMFCNTKRFSGNCLVFPGNGANVGEVYFYNGEFDAYQRTYVLHSISKRLLPRLLYYHFLSNWKSVGTAKQYGSATNFIKIGNFNDYFVSFPSSLTEQQRIVDILDREFAKIDALKVNAEKSLQAAKDLFQATLKKELEPKEGWKSLTIGELSNKITDGSHNPPKGIADSKYRMLSSQNVWNGHLDKSVARYLTEKDFLLEDRRTCAREGDVLLTIVGTIGRTCVLTKEDENITFQRSVCIIKPKPELNPFFLCYQLQSRNEEINQQANGAAQKGFYLKQVQRLPIQLTSIQEQTRIVALLDALNDRCKALQDNYQKTLALCDDFKQALLRKAFNGEL